MTTQHELIEEIEQDARDTARWTGRPRFDPRVLEALRRVRRAAFVPEALARRAYANAPLQIGCGQTISQPYIVALMTDMLDLRREDRVLEVGTGSGYQAAVLAELSDNICSIEVIPELAARAAQVLAAEGYGRIALRTGDGALGWPERAPFDAIMVTAAAREVPPALVEQLRPGGRMVIPVGEPYGEQALRLLRKDAAGHVTSRSLLSVAFVPLTGGAGAS
ncbi:MAG TPA: protein-L-isoaspartate(D-aspartate) O-methyltransferase [Acetobacteraceae bacterium]|jgi:protein-L-isoaspartate(D-aspartate) O-methyltransferase|nr:protein-L-isoaspartate(D-aspartate) O-methyltransferase [Acetobacteraceae bacterium]